MTFDMGRRFNFQSHLVIYIRIDLLVDLMIYVALAISRLGSNTLLDKIYKCFWRAKTIKKISTRVNRYTIF